MMLRHKVSAESEKYWLSHYNEVHDRAARVLEYGLACLRLYRDWGVVNRDIPEPEPCSEEELKELTRDVFDFLMIANAFYNEESWMDEFYLAGMKMQRSFGLACLPSFGEHTGPCYHDIAMGINNRMCSEMRLALALGPLEPDHIYEYNWDLEAGRIDADDYNGTGPLSPAVEEALLEFGGPKQKYDPTEDAYIGETPELKAFRLECLTERNIYLKELLESIRTQLVVRREEFDKWRKDWINDDYYELQSYLKIEFAYVKTMFGVTHFQMLREYAARSRQRQPRDQLQKLLGKFVPNELQWAILNALDGQAMQKKELASACKCNGQRLYEKGGAKDLADLGIIAHKDGVGYYRPDSPPRPKKPSGPKPD